MGRYANAVIEMIPVPCKDCGEAVWMFALNQEVVDSMIHKTCIKDVKPTTCVALVPYEAPQSSNITENINKKKKSPKSNKNGRNKKRKGKGPK